MTFIISKSKGSGRFKYGKRHPKDPTKWAFMSQGSWSTYQEARDEGDLVEKEIQRGLTDKVAGLHARIADLVADRKSLEKDKLILVEQNNAREEQVAILRIWASIVSAIAIVATAGFCYLLVN